MSIKALNWALDLDGITSTQKVVLLVLANFADENGVCYPRHETIAAKACLSRETVLRTLARLQEPSIGLVSDAERPRRAGRFSGRTYQLNLDGKKAAKVTLAPSDAKSHGDQPCDSPSCGAESAPCDPPSHGEATESHTVNVTESHTAYSVLNHQSFNRQSNHQEPRERNPASPDLSRSADQDSDEEAAIKAAEAADDPFVAPGTGLQTSAQNPGGVAGGATPHAPEPAFPLRNVGSVAPRSTPPAQMPPTRRRVVTQEELDELQQRVNQALGLSGKARLPAQAFRWESIWRKCAGDVDEAVRVALTGKARCETAGHAITLNALERHYDDWCSAAHQSVTPAGQESNAAFMARRAAGGSK